MPQSNTCVAALRVAGAAALGAARARRGAARGGARAPRGAAAAPRARQVHRQLAHVLLPVSQRSRFAQSYMESYCSFYMFFLSFLSFGAIMTR